MTPRAKSKLKKLPAKLPAKLFVKRQTEPETEYFVADESLTALVEMGETITVGTYQLVETVEAEGVAQVKETRAITQEPHHMSIDEFRNALRTLLNDAVRAGLDVDNLLAVADEELHPAFDRLMGSITQESDDGGDAGKGSGRVRRTNY
jgi:phosphoribosylaminoimidazole carboxylase (NCAIR synthetase)